jgi:uncharacterized membrane protein YbhN (UPF0104 family)
MSRAWGWLRVLTGVAILAAVVWRVGTGPFLAGLRSLTPGALIAAAAIAVVTTACCAWRWTAVADGIGIGLPLRQAFAFYYRSLFLNAVLPGGVLGDVHRGVRHGQEAADVGLGLRAVAWERVSGQGVQIAITATILVLAASPVRGVMSTVLLGVGLVVIAAAIALRWVAGRRSATARIVRVAGADLRRGVLDRRVLPVVVTASTVMVAGHAATFLLAARTVGVTASLGTLLPVALLVMAAMSVPTSIGGWGPREGVAAAVFAAAGWGAAQGVAAATVYGVMAFVASLPGAVVLIVLARRSSSAPRPLTAEVARA